MAEGFWEQAVETYLAIDRGLFLNPQYLIGTLGNWEANPDFLAISFPEDVVWMVEVTKTPSRRLFGKITEFEQEYVPRIKVQLTERRVIRGDNPWSKWVIGFWGFVPAATKEKVEQRMRAADVPKFRVTALEDTMFPPWDERFR